MIRRALFSWAIVGFAVVSLSGCANDKQDVRAVTRTFIEASERGDTATAQTLVTEKAKQLFASGETNSSAVHGEDSSFNVGEPVVQENEATVPVTLTDDRGTSEVKVRLRREEKKWRVYAMQIPTYPGGPTVTMDYENPMSIIPQGMHAAGMIMGQVVKGLEQGTKEFSQGFEKGYSQQTFPSASPSPTVTIEEVPPPQSSH